MCSPHGGVPPGVPAVSPRAHLHGQEVLVVGQDAVRVDVLLEPAGSRGAGVKLGTPTGARPPPAACGVPKFGGSSRPHPVSPKHKAGCARSAPHAMSCPASAQLTGGSCPPPELSPQGGGTHRVLPPSPGSAEAGREPLAAGGQEAICCPLEAHGKRGHDPGAGGDRVVTRDGGVRAVGGGDPAPTVPSPRVLPTRDARRGDTPSADPQQTPPPSLVPPPRWPSRSLRVPRGPSGGAVHHLAPRSRKEI